jgi:putative DNA primase/helicase
LHEIGELAGMRKADIDKVKAFISRQDDVYRASFGRRVTPHPRQCIFIGSTNSEMGFLRDITGNRRFWPVRVTGMCGKKPWELRQDEVDQIWAETLHTYRAGERLYLEGEDVQTAQDFQRDAVERDEREGLVREYLERLLPVEWSGMDLYARRNFLSGSEFGGPTHVGTVRRNSVCNMEIWCECFGKHKEDIRPTDSYAIATIMARLVGWEKDGKYATLPIYGRQRIYSRLSV